MTPKEKLLAQQLAKLHQEQTPKLTPETSTPILMQDLAEQTIRNTNQLLMQPVPTQIELQEQAQSLLTNPKTKSLIMKLTKNLWITKDYIQLSHLERANDETRSEKSQDNNLQRLGETLGAYKLGEITNQTQILNITNVLNVLTQNGITQNTIIENNNKLLWDNTNKNNFFFAETIWDY